MFRKSGLLLCFACASAAGAPVQFIHIVSGSYGLNCGAREGNATRDLAAHCNALQTCRYDLNPTAGGPRRQCAADLVAVWSCSPDEFHRATVRATTKQGGTLVLTCEPTTGAGK